MLNLSDNDNESNRINQIDNENNSKISVNYREVFKKDNIEEKKEEDKKEKSIKRKFDKITETNE